ncbi:MAG: hypothetical protein V4645_11535 [Pseudomonadota bacterium]
MSAVRSSLIEQAATRGVVRFEKTGIDAYLVGQPDLEGRIAFKPRANGRLTAAMLHRLAECRGAWLDATELLENDSYERPDTCVRQKLQRGVAQIATVSQALADVLGTFQVSACDGLRARIPSRRDIPVIETKPVTPVS